MRYIGATFTVSACKQEHKKKRNGTIELDMRLGQSTKTAHHLRENGKHDVSHGRIGYDLC